MDVRKFFGSKTKGGERMTLFVVLPLLSILTIACIWVLAREATKPLPHEAVPSNQISVSHRTAEAALEPAVLLKKLGEAEALESQGAIVSAEAAFAALTTTNPESDRAWGGLGRMLIVCKKYRNAAAALDQACRLNLVEARHFAARGAARRAMNDLKHAIRDYRDALSLEPRNPLTSNSLLFVALEMGTPALFDRDLSKIQQENPGGEARWIMASAVTEMRAGNSKEAVDILNKASKILPRDQFRALLSDRIFSDKHSQDLIRTLGKGVSP